MTGEEVGIESFAAHCEGYGIGGPDSAQHAYDTSEPDNSDETDGPECGGCHPSYRNACIHCGPDPD